jgi:Family of unknown function (DUF6491)
MKFPLGFALGSLALSLAIGASAASAADALPGTDSCIFSTQVSGWTVLDDQTLLVEAPTGSHTYLIKLFAPAAGLAFQETLGFEDGDRNGQLCRTGDSLLIGKPVPQSMPIIAVRLLSKEEAAKLRELSKTKK